MSAWLVLSHNLSFHIPRHRLFQFLANIIVNTRPLVLSYNLNLIRFDHS